MHVHFGLVDVAYDPENGFLGACSPKVILLFPRLKFLDLVHLEHIFGLFDFLKR